MTNIYFIKDKLTIDSNLILDLVKSELKTKLNKTNKVNKIIQENLKDTKSIKNIKNINLIKLTEEEFLNLEEILEKSLVFSSDKNKNENKVEEFCIKNNLIYFDIAKVLKYGFKKLLKENQLRNIKKMDEKYFRRIEAMEFAVKYDDGKLSQGILQADLVIVGLSRTSKTPLSIYLANKSGLKIINIPLVPEMKIPKEIYSAKKIIALTISIEKLNKIREQRLKTMKAEDKASSYASFGRILEELDYSDKVIKKLGCPVIDVSEKAIEETAEIVLSLIKF